MQIKDIELANISRFRGEHMGAAMLFIILFHVWLPRWHDFYGLHRCGNIGVDIFLFLSGVGLWFSWKKLPSVKHFFLKRYLRVYPTWLVIACLYYIPRYHNGMRLWDNGYGLIDLAGDILFNWDFWLHDELTFWYIPAIMMLYTFAPFYMRLIERHPIYRWTPVMMILWCILVQWIGPIHQAVGHIEIFWSRVPIFFIGINMGEMVRRKHTVDGQCVWGLILTWLVTFASCVYLEQMTHGKFPLYVERMIYIPFTVTTIMVLNRVFRRTPRWFNRFCAFIGALSLEAYLIHIHFVLDYITPHRLGYWTTFALTVAITLPLAWILNRVMAFVTKPLERRLLAKR